MRWVWVGLGTACASFSFPGEVPARSHQDRWQDRRAGRCHPDHPRGLAAHRHLQGAHLQALPQGTRTHTRRCSRMQEAISGCSWMRSAGATNDGRSGCRRRRAVTRQRMLAAFLRRCGRGCRHSGCTERQVCTVHSAAHVLDCTAHRRTDSGDSARAGLRAAFEGAMRMQLLFPFVARCAAGAGAGGGSLDAAAC